MRFTHLLAIVGVVALLSATGFAAQQASERDQVLSSYEVLPATVSPSPVVAPAPMAGKLAKGQLAKGPSKRPGSPQVVNPRWARRTAEAAGISLPALTAYARASMLAPRGCRIGWTTLAGIGWVESQHGTIGNRVLRADGRASKPILGPALDGVDFAAVPATRESAQWHGDTVWDHAVGPMQFIPSTWRTWHSDGDGDGIDDPNDIDDAALASARYLCQSGDLMVGDNWSRSILSYNHSSDYVLNVYTAADTYADRTG